MKVPFPDHAVLYDDGVNVPALLDRQVAEISYSGSNGRTNYVDQILLIFSKSGKTSGIIPH
jgi:hypothetical protein